MTSSSTSAPTLIYPFSDLMFSPFRHRFPSIGLSLREEANRLAGQGVRPLHGNAVVPRVHYRHGLVALSAYLEGASIDKGQAAIEYHDGVTANDRAFHDFHGPAPLALPPMPFYLAFAIGTVRSARREAATGRGSPPSRKDGLRYSLFQKGAKTARFDLPGSSPKDPSQHYTLK